MWLLQNSVLANLMISSSFFLSILGGFHQAVFQSKSKMGIKLLNMQDARKTVQIAALKDYSAATLAVLQLLAQTIYWTKSKIIIYTTIKT